ncbi:MAG: DUF1080 domain-containing protein [Planctomycetales bacterium]|nr:DUF1080 domain-containing protein [Planctomycetales bacterium]
MAHTASPSFLAAAEPEDGQWQSMFNGTNLDGWHVKIRGYDLNDNFGNTFRVEDGMLKVRYDAYEQFNERYGHIFYKDKFANYRMRVEYRFVGEQCPGGPGWALRNSGIMIHGESPTSMAKDQDFPVSIEVQLLGGDGTNARTTGNLCTPGTNVEMNGKLITQHCTSSRSKTYHGEQWVTAEVEVRGGRVIKHMINDEEVLSYQAPQYDPRDAHAKQLAGEGGLILKEGTISLQSESHPVDFRKIEIMELKDEPSE